jgi:hypothetical protein
MQVFAISRHIAKMLPSDRDRGGADHHARHDPAGGGLPDHQDTEN